MLDRLAAILRDFSTIKIEVLCHESREPGTLPANGPGMLMVTRQRAGAPAKLRALRVNHA